MSLVTKLGAIGNSENLLVRMLIGALLSVKVLELASDVLGIVCFMGIIFYRKFFFASFLQFCGLVDVDAR